MQTNYHLDCLHKKWAIENMLKTPPAAFEVCQSVRVKQTNVYRGRSVTLHADKQQVDYPRVSLPVHECSLVLHNYVLTKDVCRVSNLFLSKFSEI